MIKGEVWGHLPGQEPVLGVSGEEDSTKAKIAIVLPKSPAERRAASGRRRSEVRRPGHRRLQGA